jgi:DNA-binding transcriptional LysR family regulator
MRDSLEDLSHENLDLAVRVGDLVDSSLVARKLAESHSVVCASPAYLAKNGTPIHPTDLKGHSCLSFRTHVNTHKWRFKTAEGLLEVPVTGRLKVNGLSFLRAAALNNLGVIMLPVWMLQNELKQQQLVPILEEYSLPSVPISVIFSHNRQLVPKVRVFVDFLVERMQHEFA